MAQIIYGMIVILTTFIGVLVADKGAMPLIVVGLCGIIAIFLTAKFDGWVNSVVKFTK